MRVIALSKRLPFWSSMSKHCHSNTVNVLCYVLATSFLPVRDFCNSSKKIFLKHEFDKGMRELNRYMKKKFLKVRSQVEVLAFGAYVFES